MTYLQINFVLQVGRAGAWSAVVDQTHKVPVTSFQFHFLGRAPLWVAAKSAVFARGWTLSRLTKWSGQARHRWVTLRFSGRMLGFITTARLKNLSCLSAAFECVQLARPPGYDFSRWSLTLTGSTFFSTRWNTIVQHGSLLRSRD